jgi:hypothetical protein
VASNLNWKWPGLLPCLSTDNVDVVAAWGIALHLPVELPGVAGAVVLVATGPGTTYGDVGRSIALTAGIWAGYLHSGVRSSAIHDRSAGIRILPHERHGPRHVEGDGRRSVRRAQSQETIRDRERLRLAKGLEVCGFRDGDREAACAHAHGGYGSVCNGAGACCGDY